LRCAARRGPPHPARALGRGDLLGTLEPGNYADVAVLSADYFDASKVSDDALKKLRSVLTLVGGAIVHGDAGAL